MEIYNRLVSNLCYPDCCRIGYTQIAGEMNNGTACVLTCRFVLRVRTSRPVSYTHLDVYKRQILAWTFLIISYPKFPSVFISFYLIYHYSWNSNQNKVKRITNIHTFKLIQNHLKSNLVSSYLQNNFNSFNYVFQNN